MGQHRPERDGRLSGVRHVVAVGQNSVFVSFDGVSFTEVPQVSAEQLSAIAIAFSGALYLGSISFEGSSKGVLRSLDGAVRGWCSAGRRWNAVWRHCWSPRMAERSTPGR